jgi:MATE family multidrug resistance protein
MSDATANSTPIAPQPVPVSAQSAMRAEFGAMLRLAGPLAAANLLQMLVYAIDVIFVARLGEQALAASSLSIALFSLMAWGSSAMTGAVAPLIAAELGARRNAVREVRRSVRMGLWLAVMLGLGCMAVSWQGEAILRAAGQNAVVAARAGGFLQVLAFAIVPMILSNVLRNFISALGRPAFATAITALAILVNGAGNYAFVFGHWGAPALGLNGSGLASVCTAWATLAAYLFAIRLDRRLRRYRILGRWWRPEWSRFREIVRIGIPIAFTVIAEGGLFGSAAFLMGLIGQTELAGHAVALQIAALAFQVPFGIGQAATIRVGYAYGAQDSGAVKRAGAAALWLGLGFAVGNAILMLFTPRMLLSAYVDVNAVANAAMVGFAVRYLAIGAAFQLADSTQTIAAGALRGLQDTRWPMTIALGGYWLPGFGTAALLGLLTPLRGLGVWLGLAIGLLVVAVLMVRRWWARERLGLLPG